MTPDWTPLRAELEIWRAEGRRLPLWWRDDDAIEPTPQLDRLADLSRGAGVPVHLAIIPAHATPGLRGALETQGVFRPMVHGWAHENHAPLGEKSSEFGQMRGGAAEELTQAMARMTELFGDTLCPVFVPPWNRFHPDLTGGLRGAGYRALSTYGPRKQPMAAPGVLQINTQIDPVDWRGTRGLADPDAQITTLTAHLAARRTGAADPDEPLGLLTHHLMQDDATWEFCAALLDLLGEVGTAVEIGDLVAG